VSVAVNPVYWQMTGRLFAQFYWILQVEAALHLLTYLEWEKRPDQPRAIPLVR